MFHGNGIAGFIVVAQPAYLADQIQIAAVLCVVSVAHAQRYGIGFAFAGEFIVHHNAADSTVAVEEVGCRMGICCKHAGQVMTAFVVTADGKVMTDLYAGHFGFKVETLFTIAVQTATQQARPSLTFGLVAAGCTLIPSHDLVFATAFVQCSRQRVVTDFLVHLRHQRIC